MLLLGLTVGWDMSHLGHSRYLLLFAFNALDTHSAKQIKAIF